jgi:hypothetical protein
MRRMEVLSLNLAVDHLSPWLARLTDLGETGKKDLPLLRRMK